MCHVSCVMCHARFRSVECDVSRPIHECDLPRVWLRKNSFISVSDDCGTRSSVMGWLRLVGCLKIYVSLQNIGLFCRALLQKRPIFLSILLIVATPYVTLVSCELTSHWVHNSLSWQVTEFTSHWVDTSLSSQLTELTSHWVVNSVTCQVTCHSVTWQVTCDLSSDTQWLVKWLVKSLCSQLTELTSHWVHKSLITQFKTQFTTHKTKSNTNFSCEWQFTTHF